MELLDISAAKRITDRRLLGNKLYKIKEPSPYQWPRKYGMKVKDSVRNKTWELRKYKPEVIND